jgi:hypothetical protein
MVVLRNGSKCSHNRCMLCFFTISLSGSRDFAKLNLLFLNPNLIFEIGSIHVGGKHFL